MRSVLSYQNFILTVFYSLLCKTAIIFFIFLIKVNLKPDMLRSSLSYSYRRESVGSDEAALMDWKLTVIKATTKTRKPDNTKIIIPTLVR